jgi:hypothetical protein
MDSTHYTDAYIINILKPETDLEMRLINHPIIREGLLWGEPRYGHPEGKVLYHIPEIFENIERTGYPLSKIDRSRLRLIAILHDTMKYQEDKNEPRDWSKHHSILARRFSEAYIADEVILDIIELHDEAYYCWRLHVLEDEPDYAAFRLKMLLQRIEPFVQLYYVFFKCDTATGDKTQAPVKWFEKNIPGIAKFDFTK